MMKMTDTQWVCRLILTPQSLRNFSMTPWQNRVTDLTRQMADDMKLRNFSQRTIDAYTYHVGRFAKFLGRSPLEATAEDVRSFQLHMIEVRKIGAANTGNTGTEHRGQPL